MARRASHYVASGMLVVAALAWAARDAWSGRRALTAPPIRVVHAYVEYADTLRRRETVSDVLARGGITGADGAALLAAATNLPVRRLRPGLVLQFRRLQTEHVPDRVSVRVSPDLRLSLERGDA